MAIKKKIIEPKPAEVKIELKPIAPVLVDTSPKCYLGHSTRLIKKDTLFEEFVCDKCFRRISRSL